MNEVLRKSSQEVEIDRMLEEEFLCDAGFADRFARRAGITFDGTFAVESAVSEPSLGEGFGDLLVQGHTARGSAALLIEDKITAGPAVRQAERYRTYAETLRRDGTQVWTVLVAPAAYRGESNLFDGRVALEEVAEILQNPCSERLAHRRAILRRAISKKQSSGVQVPDAGVRELRAIYFGLASSQLPDHRFPALRSEYYDGDAWIEPILHSSMPTGWFIRHRLWTGMSDLVGRVDLITKRDRDGIRDVLASAPFPDAEVDNYSKKGAQLTVRVPEIRPAGDRNVERIQHALKLIGEVTRWSIDSYHELRDAAAAA